MIGPGDWEVYRDAHIAICDKCRAAGDRLSNGCYKHVQRAHREFMAKVAFIEGSKRRRENGR